VRVTAAAVSTVAKIITAVTAMTMVAMVAAMAMSFSCVAVRGRSRAFRLHLHIDAMSERISRFECFILLSKFLNVGPIRGLRRHHSDRSLLHRSFVIRQVSRNNWIVPKL
jgi:hypothetical protein